jgi:hypothetical protein
MSFLNPVGMAGIVVLAGSMINLRSAEALRSSSISKSEFVRVSPRDL